MNVTTSRSFPLGQTVITPNAKRKLHPHDIYAACWRHAHGDWGNCSKEDGVANEFALKIGYRVFSVYDDRNGSPFWVITEADRSSTIILLPEEY